MPNPGPPRKLRAAEYPPLPAHVLERLAGYLAPGLNCRMAVLRDSEHAPT
jgi:hypothetical protein